ncbi:MAG: 4Fe-4S dicluster domain-containing protein [Eggerthellaceae bacterium]|nr:4Fe-4S dicluster domain-containing protein [Eggerthellaceae bacterium]
MEETKEKQAHAGMSRRAFAIGGGGAAVLLAMGGLKAVPAQAKTRPPGGQDEDRLISACIRCERCVETCPRNALAPMHIEDGILGVRTPVTNFDEGYCDFCQEANGGDPLCVKCCPTQALQLTASATAESTIIGKAVINENWCLAWSKANGCRFCYDACPYEAIELTEKDNRPVVIADRCNGCGACQSVCVSLQEGSITLGATARAIVVVPESEL